MNEQLTHAISIVKNGGVLIYPTDTAIGIGCRIDNHEAVSRIFSIKGRETNKATPVLFSDVLMVEKYVKPFSEKVRSLMDTHWPGALTIIIDSQEEIVDELIRGGRKGIGTRVPNQVDILTLIEEVGVPLIGTSANFSGEATVFNTIDVNSQLQKLVDYILPGECMVKQSSTVIDCSDEPWKILRQGAISIEL